MYDSPDVPMNTTPTREDERLSLVHKLIDVERELDDLRERRADIEVAREENQARTEKAQMARREVIDTLASHLGIDSGVAAKAPSRRGEF